MTTSLSAAELAHLVTAVPGVRAIEPGIGSTLRALGSHMRQQDPQQARFGVIVEEGSSRAVMRSVSMARGPSRTSCATSRRPSSDPCPRRASPTDASEAREGSASSDVGEQSAPQVTVRVQSLL